MTDQGAVAKHDQEQAETLRRRADDVEQVRHEASLTSLRFTELVAGGLTEERAYELVRDWHSATFCDGCVMDDGEAA